MLNLFSPKLQYNLFECNTVTCHLPGTDEVMDYKIKSAYMQVKLDLCYFNLDL